MSCCYAVSSCQFCQSPTPTVDLLTSATSLRQPEDTYVATRIQFLPRDAMLSSCVCLFVCPSVKSWYCFTTTGRIELVFGMKASFHLSHTVLLEIWGSPKIRALPSGTLSETPSLDKKLSYCRGTARCVVSVEILPVATQQCRNYLYDKS